jgi:acetoin utilization protein AcuC
MSTGRPTAFLYAPEFLSYDLGPKHPLQQRRLHLVCEQLLARQVLKPPVADGPVAYFRPSPVDEALLARVHTADYLDAVRRASDGATGDWLDRFGLGAGDTPAFPGMYEAARLYAGGTADAAALVLDGTAQIAFNVAGGFHHAHPGRASGFCTFNDLAVGVLTLLDGGLERVAYIDIDAHHGDGVQACFWDDPRVLTISLHESGRWLFPGTGFPDERGGPDALGTALNLPFAPGTGDAIWHEAFDAVVPEALARFAPQALVLQLGADAHYGDPLAHLQLTARGWLQALTKLLTLGSDLPIVVTGGGGYNLKTVERLWTLTTLACAGLPLPEDLLAEPEPPAIDRGQREQAAQYAQEAVRTLRRGLGWSLSL